MSKTAHQELEDKLRQDGLLLQIHPFDTKLTGYQIELVELKVKWPYEAPTFKFKITWIRVERIAESYTLAFYYNVRSYNSHIQSCIHNYFNVQLSLGAPEDQYKALVDDIRNVHYEYKRDTKDVDLFMLEFTTISSKYDTDRESNDFTIIEWSVLPTDFIELVKLRRHLDWEKRFCALLTDDDSDTIEKLEHKRIEQRDQRQLLENSMKDPFKEFKKALEDMRNIAGKHKTYEFIKETMEALIAIPDITKKIKISKAQLEAARKLDKPELDNEHGDKFIVNWEQVSEEEARAGMSESELAVLDKVAEVRKKGKKAK